MNQILIRLQKVKYCNSYQYIFFLCKVYGFNKSITNSDKALHLLPPWDTGNDTCPDPLEQIPQEISLESPHM